MIVGIGIDIVSVEQIAQNIYREQYRQKIFTSREVEECLSVAYSHERFAGKFAVKEAFMKAIGAGIRQGVGFTHIEILTSKSGKPILYTTHQAQKIANELGILNIHISLSHSAGMAIGMVVLEQLN